MSFGAAERLAQTLLYEGYVLYPYRRSSLKNRQRWPLGALYPPAFCAHGHGDPSAMQSECIVLGATPFVRVSVRFLQLEVSADEDATDQQPWHEAIERRIDVPELALCDVVQVAHCTEVELPIGRDASAHAGRRLAAQIHVSATMVAEGAFRLRVSIENHSHSDERERTDVLPCVLASTHTLLACRDGQFVSLLEPPTELQAETARCANVGCFPVLVGDPGVNDVMLCSPIILYDRPRIAGESRGDFFDLTEIDEILSLRVLTLTERERAEALATDPRARQLLERTEALDEAALLGLHGTRREPPTIDGTELAPGARVRIRPRRGGEVLDLALAGELATIAKIEQDLEGRFFYAVTVDCDPGRDLGLEGQPGHRFFFSADELEPAP